MPKRIAGIFHLLADRMDIEQPNVSFFLCLMENNINETFVLHVDLIFREAHFSEPHKQTRNYETNKVVKVIDIFSTLSVIDNPSICFSSILRNQHEIGMKKYGRSSFES